MDVWNLGWRKGWKGARRVEQGRLPWLSKKKKKKVKAFEKGKRGKVDVASLVKQKTTLA